MFNYHELLTITNPDDGNSIDDENNKKSNQNAN